MHAACRPLVRQATASLLHFPRFPLTAPVLHHAKHQKSSCALHGRQAPHHDGPWTWWGVDVHPSCPHNCTTSVVAAQVQMPSWKKTSPAVSKCGYARPRESQSPRYVHARKEDTCLGLSAVCMVRHAQQVGQGSSLARLTCAQAVPRLTPISTTKTARGRQTYVHVHALSAACVANSPTACSMHRTASIMQRKSSHLHMTGCDPYTKPKLNCQQQ